VKTKVLIVDKIFKRGKEWEQVLRQKFPEVLISGVSNEDEIGDFIEEAEILVTHGISDELIKKASKLQWLQGMGTGVDRILTPSLRKEVLVTSSRGIHGPQMSEMAILLMLSLNRDIPHLIRNQDQRIWERRPGRLLHQKKVGIFGVGVIGEELARKCKAFGMTVFGIDIVRREIDSIDLFYGPEDLIQVAKEVDYLVLVAPYTPETRKIIGSKVLASMKPSAFLINIARGELVDNEALIEALEAGKIAGAALDALHPEPLPKDHPLWGTKNVIITSHVGGMSDIYMEQILPIFEENLRRFLSGERRNLVNFIERG
jgi:phosphoglycerate dehydrogenase-like enzyme